MPQPQLTTGKDPVPIVQEAWWTSGPVWTNAENSPPPAFDPRTVHPVGSRYTDYPTRLLDICIRILFEYQCLAVALKHGTLVFTQPNHSRGARL